MIDALFRYGFLQHAVIAVILGSVACGLIGSLLFVNRLSSLSGGISHAVFGGLGFALLAGIPPIAGAGAASILAALLLGFLAARSRSRSEAAIAAVWSVGMSLGLVFVSLAPGYRGDLMGYLFGSILAVPMEDLVMTAVVDAASLFFVIVFYRRILAISFDPEFSSARGIHAGALYTAFLCLTGLSVVVLMRSVGLVMVIALLSIPAATARLCTHRLPVMMTLSCFFSAAAGLAGLAGSWALDLPSGACIVLASATGFTLVSGFFRLRKALSQRDPHGCPSADRAGLHSVTLR
jgi:zinc transport system permease protein